MGINEKYRPEMETALALAREAGRAIMEHYHGSLGRSLKIDTKQDGTPVTNGDIQANEIILGGLRKAFPCDGVVSEESTELSTAGSGARSWYVDPIDGTRGFIEHSAQFAVHIGLAEEGKPVLGVVYQPATGETYYAAKNTGAYRVSPSGIESRLRVSNESDNSSESLTGIGPRVIVDKDALLAASWPEIAGKLHPRRILLSGSEGLRICKIAEGIADLHFNGRKCSTWDVCAPQCIAEEAGAYVSYFTGKPIVYHGQRRLDAPFIFAASREWYDLAIPIIWGKLD